MFDPKCHGTDMNSEKLTRGALCACLIQTRGDCSLSVWTVPFLSWKSLASGIACRATVRTAKVRLRQGGLFPAAAREVTLGSVCLPLALGIAFPGARLSNVLHGKSSRLHCLDLCKGQITYGTLMLLVSGCEIC